MTGMALGRTVAERISTTVVTHEVPTGAATETISEEISEATTEVASEAASVVGVVVEGTTTIVVTICTGTKTGGLLHGTGQGDRGALPTRGTNKRTARERTVLRKSPPSSACQTPRNPHNLHRKMEKMSLDVTSGRPHWNGRKDILPSRIRHPGNPLYNTRHTLLRRHRIRITKVSRQHLYLHQYLPLPTRHLQTLPVPYRPHRLQERAGWTRLIYQPST